MTLRFFRLCFISALVLNALSLTVNACSYADGYLPLTNYDLVKESDAILLAQPTSKSGYNVEFDVLEVLKGEFESAKFLSSEMHTSCVDYSYSLELTAPKLLFIPNPKKIKLTYVLFLHKAKAGWTISSAAADRMNNMIFDLDASSFLTTVRHFVRIDSKDDYEIEKKELKRLLHLARSGQDPKEYPKELIDLIDGHLKSPTASKSYQDLVALYKKSSKNERRQVLWAFAWGKHREAANFFTTLLKSPIPSNYLGPISEYISQTKNEPLLVKVGRNYPQVDKQARWPVMWAMIKTADGRHVEMMLAALRSADKEEAGRLAEWFVRNPSDEASQIVRSLVGKAYKENWELTFSLAGMGDVDTLNWAKECMNSPGKDSWMAYYAIAHSPLDEADGLAKSVISGNNSERLIWLVQGFQESHNPNRWNRLRDIANLPNRDTKVDEWLRRTLEAMADEGDNKATEMLKDLPK